MPIIFLFFRQVNFFLNKNALSLFCTKAILLQNRCFVKIAKTENYRLTLVFCGVKMQAYKGKDARRGRLASFLFQYVCK
jgi:hypothetical protein